MYYGQNSNGSSNQCALLILLCYPLSYYMLHSKKIIRIIIDLFSINLAFLFTYWLTISEDIFSTRITTLWLIINLLWFSTLSFANKLYGRFEYTRFRIELKSVLDNLLLHITGLSLYYFLIYKGPVLPIVTFFVVFTFLIFAGRFILHLLLPRLRSIATLNYITIGFSKALPGVEKTITDTHLGKVKYLGSFGENIPSHYKNLGYNGAIYDFLQKSNVNLILYASNELDAREARKLMNYAKLNFIDFKIIPLELELLSSGIKMEVHGGFPILSVQDENIARIRNRLIKRLFDILFSLVVILLIFPLLFLILATLIKLESPGPILFIQERVGFRNQTFWCYKFRSMIVTEEGKNDKYQQAVKGDNRITKIGAFMRRTNLDEFPQFFNVLIGNMSVVGPRPHPVKLDINLKKEIEEYILRHYTKPGLTGWAQVNGWRGPTETKEQKEGRSKHDIWYLRNWSFWLDLRIIFMTVFSSKSRENAF